jgi:hypothetical protein
MLPPRSRVALANLGLCTPTVVVFATTNEPDAIQVAHSVSHYPTDITHVSPMDGLMVGLVGNNPANCVPVAFTAGFHTVALQTVSTWL